MPSLHSARLRSPAKAKVAPARVLRGTCSQDSKGGAALGLFCILQLQIHRLWASHWVLNREFTALKGSWRSTEGQTPLRNSPPPCGSQRAQTSGIREMCLIFLPPP